MATERAVARLRGEIASLWQVIYVLIALIAAAPFVGAGFVWLATR